MIEQYASPISINNSQEPWLVGEGVVVSGGVAIPSLDLNFITGGLPGTVTFTRASDATFFNSAGVLTTAGNNVARFDYDPSTLAARGLLIEEQRVNSIRNNTMQGAVAGTPGTAPTNWQVYGSASGLTQQIVGVGTESGISYIDIKYAGTTSGAQNNVIFARPESNIQVAALNGQSWTQSAYVRLVGGSLSNITINVGIVEYSGAGAALAGSRTTITPTAAGLATQTYSHTRALNNASTAFVVGGVEMTFVSGVAIDITLRIGLPQLEQGAFATSVIPTTGSTATRNADAASVNTLSPWYNQSAGTLMLEAVAPTGTTTLFPVVVTNGTVEIASIRTFSNTVRFGIEGVASGSAGSITAGNTYKAALGYTSGDQAMSVNSAAVLTGTTVLTTTASIFRVGANASGTGGFANSWLRRIAYYPRRLSNTELQAITAA